MRGPYPPVIMNIVAGIVLLLLGALDSSPLFCQGHDAHECRTVDAHANNAATLPLAEPHGLPFLPTVDTSVPFPVYYINMAQSRKRRERIERTFGPLWDLHRFPAIDGANKTAVEAILGPANYAALKPFLVSTLQKESGDGFYALSEAEVGCILSHLLAVRQAYLAGHEAAMIMEDDLSPLLMPFWTSSISDLLREAEGTSWDTIQLSWLVIKNKHIYDTVSWAHDARLVKQSFQYGAGAYLISRKGMEAIMALFFEDQTPTGLIKPLLEPSRRLLLIECYFEKLNHTLVTMPALFTTDTVDTTIGDGKLSRLRLISYRLSSDKHIDATLDLFHRVACNQS